MVAFNHIPASIRVPFFYAEVDPARNRGFQENPRALIVAQMLAAGIAAAGEPILCAGTDAGRELFGIGSHAAAMVEIWRQNDPYGELHVLPLADAGGATAAAGEIALSGTASAAGALSIWIAGRRVQIAVASGTAAAAVATALAAAINADTLLPVTAAAAAGDVTLTARNKGTLGNGIDIRKNYAGIPGGERDVPGLTATITAMAAGAGDPDIGAALAALGDAPFDYIVLPYSDTTSLDALQAEMNDVAGRWSYARQIYGHGFTAKRDTVGNLASFGTARNDPHVSCIGFSESPSPAWAWATAFAAVAARALRIDPARPLNTLPLIGILPPQTPAGAISFSEQNTLLYDGITTWTVDAGGRVTIGRAISMHRLNVHGQPDQSYLDVTTTATIQLLLRELRARMTQRFGRAKLASDGTRFGPGQVDSVATPSLIRGEIVALYSEWEARALVENVPEFKRQLRVERDANDPTRLNVVWPPDLVNPLHIMAVLAQYQLQYPAAA